MLKTLQKLTRDKALKENCFDEKLQQDSTKFIEYLFLSPLDIAGKVQGKLAALYQAKLIILSRESLTANWTDTTNRIQRKTNNGSHRYQK